MPQFMYPYKQLKKAKLIKYNIDHFKRERKLCKSKVKGFFSLTFSNNLPIDLSYSYVDWELKLLNEKSMLVFN